MSEIADRATVAFCAVPVDRSSSGAMRYMNQQRAAVNEQFENDLRVQYLNEGVPDVVAAEVYRVAYDIGHASGFDEIESHYAELSAIPNTWAEYLK